MSWKYGSEEQEIMELKIWGHLLEIMVEAGGLVREPPTAFLLDIEGEP